MSRKTRKLIWSAPLVAVFAVVGALAAFGALGLGGVFADELHNAPQNLKVAAASGDAARTTLVLNWEAPASGAPDMYRIDVSKNNQKFTFLTEVSGTALTYNHEVRPRGEDSDPKGGWKRYYRVYAMNSHGYGEVSSSESATTKAQAEPGEVGSVTFSTSDPTQIDVKWATPGDGGSDILGYCIRVWPTGTSHAAPAPISDATCLDKFASDGPGGSAGDYVNDGENGNGSEGDNDQAGDVIRADAMMTEYVHKNLRALQMWSYEVFAFNMHGHSQTSSGVVNATSDDPDRPTYPGSLLGRQDHSRGNDDAIIPDADPRPDSTEDSNDINVYWTAASDGGQDITRYEVEISDTSGHWPSQAYLDVDANVPTAVLGGNNPTKTADGNANNGQLNPDLADTTGDIANVAVVWVGANAQPEMPYQLRHTYTGSDEDNSEDDDTITNTPRTYKSKLYYRVRTVAGTGSSEMESAWSRGHGVSVKNVVGTDSDDDELPIFVPPVAAPTLDADANDNVPNGSDATDADMASDDEDGPTTANTDDDDDLVPGQIKLTISGAVTGADSYRVDVSDDGGATWTTSHDFTLPINKDDYDHRGLKPEERLSFRFFAKDGSDIGLASNVVADYAGNTDQPGDVRNLVAARHSTDGAGKINLSWNAPAKNGGADIEQYCILVNLLGENDAVGSGAMTRNMIFTSNYAADHAQRDTVADGTDPIPANCTRLGEPDATDKNGVMTISVSGDNNVYQVDHDTTMVTFTGLEQETRWQFEVFALNKASDTDVDNDGTAADTDAAELDENGGRHALSADSDEKKAGTGSAIAPMAPMRLSAQLARDTDPDAIAGGIGNQGVLILWNPPSDPVGAKVLSYMIERKVDDGDFETEVATHPVGLTHWVDTDELGADETRAYRVSATNAVGTGTAMATVMIPYPPTHTTHPPAGATDLTEPTNVVATSTVARELTLTWEGAENAEYYILVAVDVAAYAAGDLVYETASVSDGAARTGMVSNLNSGTSYLGIVFAVKGTDADIELMHGVAAAAELVQ